MPITKLQPIMKRDGRSNDRKTQEAIRLMAVERILEGEDVTSVMASYGLCRTTAYKWLSKVRGRGHGMRALSARKGTGRPATLTAAQKRQSDTSKRSGGVGGRLGDRGFRAGSAGRGASDNRKDRRLRRTVDGRGCRFQRRQGPDHAPGGNGGSFSGGESLGLRPAIVSAGWR